MSKEKLKNQGFVVPSTSDYDKIYGSITFNPTMITCSCGSCNKDHQIEEVDNEILSELDW